MFFLFIRSRQPQRRCKNRNTFEFRRFYRRGADLTAELGPLVRCHPYLISQLIKGSVVVLVNNSPSNLSPICTGPTPAGVPV